MKQRVLEAVVVAGVLAACAPTSVDLGGEPQDSGGTDGVLATGGAVGSGATGGSVGTGGTAGSGAGGTGAGAQGGDGTVSGVPLNPPLPRGACPGTVAVPPDPPEDGSTKAPCDIYAEDGGPCVAAHSTVRALYATYAGALYQVKRSDGATMDILAASPGGLADSASHDTFCSSGACTISVVYDQSGQGNHLRSAPAGGAKSTPDNEAPASAVVAHFAGQKAYGVHIAPGIGYRNNDACGTATGDEAETEYMVVAGGVFNAGCCFDYGNLERNSQDGGEGAAEAIYFGSSTIWGRGAGDGPWVMGDLENGLWAGDTSSYEGNPSLSFKYVTALLKGDGPGSNHWTLKSGDAQSGALTVPFDGPRPSPRYHPMKKQGAVGLGTAGDNSSGGEGDFFEGVMTAHYSSDEADDAVQANIAAVYGSASKAP